VAFSTSTATRRRLIDSGSLLDVTRLAHTHRIVVPTAIAVGAWKACGGRTEEFATAAGDALASRVLAAARSQAVHSRPSTMAAAVLGFAVEDAGSGRIVELELAVGPGDDGDPVATIDLPAY
jgi:hypothetical protein